jgi:hypothetical protein
MTCPYCKKDVSEEASICPYCQKNIYYWTIGKREPEATRIRIGFISFAITFLLTFIMFPEIVLGAYGLFFKDNSCASCCCGGPSILFVVLFQSVISVVGMGIGTGVYIMFFEKKKL